MLTQEGADGVNEEIEKIGGELAKVLQEILDLIKKYQPYNYQLLIESITKMGEIYSKEDGKLIAVEDIESFINTGMNLVKRNLSLKKWNDVFWKSLELENKVPKPHKLREYEDVIKEVEIYMTTEGIVSSHVPYGYMYSELSLSDLYQFVDLETKEILDFIRDHNPNLFYKKFYIIKPRFEYEKPEKIWKVNGRIVLAKRGGRYYYPKFIEDQLRIRIPIERLFTEDEGAVKISGIIKLWSGSEVKYDLLEVRVKFRGKHPGLPLSEFKFLKQCVRKYLEEFGKELDPRFRDYLLNKVSRTGSRNHMFTRIWVNERLIDSKLDQVAYIYSEKLGDPEEKRKKYSLKYRGSLILPVKSDGRLADIFGHQKLSIVARDYFESLWRNRKKLKELSGMKFERKEKVIFEEGLFWYILRWKGRVLNHVVFSEDEFDVHVLGWDKYNIYFITPKKNGQKLTLINKHHGKEGYYSIRVRLNLDEVLQIIHLDPDLPDAEAYRILKEM